MSPTETLVLEQGRIPAHVVLTEVITYVEQRGEKEVPIIAAKAGLTADTLWSWINGERGQHEGISFNHADKLFIAMGLVHLWRGEYADYYYGVNLDVVECACEGCNTIFELRLDTLGRQNLQLYCSSQCAQAAYKIRKGRNKQRLAKSKRAHVGRPPGGSSTVCRNGHVRTPENTHTRGNGRVECRECSRAANKRYYESKAA